MVKQIKIFLLSAPPGIIIWKSFSRLFKIKIRRLKEWQALVSGKNGLEIGGPSPMFNRKGYLPLYAVIKKLDGVNFGQRTVWEGVIEEGLHFKYDSRIGYQYIAEGSELVQIEKEHYDFVLSCNNLEHIANPIKALQEWKRIIKPSGHVLLVLPNKLSNFDHRRPITSFHHLVKDFEKNIGEDDLTHLDEVLELHDLGRDWLAGGKDAFEQRCRNNLNNRCLHHHVFDQKLLKEIFEYVEMKVLLQQSSKTDHFIVAQKI